MDSWNVIALNWFEIAAGIVSVFGLLFSLLAWIRAGRATTAAHEARNAITIRTLADEFQLACERMDQLLDFIEHERFEEAALRARELASALSEIPYRRSSHLEQDSLNELLNTRIQIEDIGKEIMTNRGQPLAPERKYSLFQIYQQSSRTLRKNLGIIKREIDMGTRQ